MDEDLSIINSETRSEKIKSFFINNKKRIITTILSFVIFTLSFYSYQVYKDGLTEQLSNKYNSATIDYKNGNNSQVISTLREIVEAKDSTYSPLALYFLIDNNLIKNKSKINDLFDILIEDTPLDSEIRSLIIYKKGLYNAGSVNEVELLNILNPIINSNSVWKSHALYLVGEYFYSINEKQKSKEFFFQILNTKNANQDILQEAQKRLNRDLSD